VPNPANHPTTPSSATPALQAEALQEQGRMLDRLLGRQLGRLRQRFFVHGMGYVVGALALALAAYYLLDRTLGLPGPVRIVLTLAVALLVFSVARRRLIYPLTRRFSRTDMALALEGAFPKLRQALVSAFQLKSLLSSGAATRNQSPEMIQRLVAQTTQEVRDLPVDRVLNVRRTLRVWGVAGACLLAVTIGAYTQGTAAGIFAQRLLGADVPYPRATTLYIELPESSEAVRVEIDGRAAVVTLASQTDLHVNIRAEGEVPRDVYLVVDSGSGERELAASPRADGRFRHVFRRVQGTFRFYATGGDDDRGNFDVEVRTIDPPLVGRISATVTPPAYTGGAPEFLQGGGVEALGGSSVRIEIAPTAPVLRGDLVFEESGQRVALEKGLPESGDGNPVWSGAFAVQGNDRYRVELVGDTGLTNPQSGSYAVVALPDFAPVGRLLTPDTTVLSLTPDGIVPVRAEFRDDWGVTGGSLQVQTARTDAATERDLLPVEFTQALRVQVAHLFSVRELYGSEEATQGNLGLLVRVRDNRAPAPQVTELPSQQVSIVDQAQLSAQIHRHFRAVREDVEEALSLQQDRLLRLEDLVEGFRAGSASQQQGMISSVEVGQGRIRTLADQVHLRLMQAFDLHLFNRLEGDNPTSLVTERYLEFYRGQSEARPYVAEFYAGLAADRLAGRIPAMPKVLDPILAMLTIARQIAEDHAIACSRALTQAQVADNSADIADYCENATEEQKRILSGLKDLLERLGEWNDFQDVIQETRSLRDKQRDVQSRTQELQGK